MSINSLDFANLSLNQAMPREYLDPPRPVESESGAVDAEGNRVTGDTSQAGVKNSQASVMVPLSSVETVLKVEVSR